MLCARRVFSGQFRLFVLLGIVALSQSSWSQDPWRVGRIVDVQKNVTTKTLYWLVNTPVIQDETEYTISVHLGNKIVMGSYPLSKTQSEPPEEWTKGRPVKVRFEDNQMFLRTPIGHELKLDITKRKSTAPMEPITPAELEDLNATAKQENSLIGFDEPTSKSSEAHAPADKKPEPPATPIATPPPQPPPSMGTISVRSTPYLAEVYVDGNDMGYTPAKVSLPPGKHTIRFEKPGYKPWSKEVTLTVGSELNVDATLQSK